MICYTNDFPLISFGIAIPMIFNTVGAISESHHFAFSFWTLLLLMYRKGTGFILCAVIGDSDVHISSLFPWSAVIKSSKLFLLQNAIKSLVMVSNFFIAVMTASILPV